LIAGTFCTEEFDTAPTGTPVETSRSKSHAYPDHSEPGIISMKVTSLVDDHSIKLMQNAT
jgi:hypothetical protein